MRHDANFVTRYLTEIESEAIFFYFSKTMSFFKTTTLSYMGRRKTAWSSRPGNMQRVGMISLSNCLFGHFTDLFAAPVRFRHCASPRGKLPVLVSK